ncbi:Uncharacterised protein [uncultured archaeon]|nr:Uncharacterised protein [uncultured archaeon]
MALIQRKIKKLAKVAGGLGVILIDEARKARWTNDDYLRVELHQEGKEYKIVITKTSD